MKSNFKNILFYIPFLFALFTILGCNTKVINVPIAPKLPYLKQYENNRSIILHAYNKNGYVCIKEWNNSCLPKDKLKDLLTYIYNLKLNLKKCNIEIKNYQEFYKKYNKQIKDIK